MLSLQLKPVNSICADLSDRKCVVTATWQILWLAGQAVAQVGFGRYKQTVDYGDGGCV